MKKNPIIPKILNAIFVAAAAAARYGPTESRALQQQPDLFDWAVWAGGTNNDSGRAIAVDGSGNIFVTGYFMGEGMFGTTNVSVGSTSWDIFVAKYDSAGGLLWVRQAGGTMSDCGKSIAVDQEGNVYVSGFFSRSATFGPFTVTSPDPGTMFVAKYDRNGNVLWYGRRFPKRGYRVPVEIA